MKQSSMMQQLAQAIALGSQFIGIFVAAIAIGRVIDHFLRSDPFGILLGVMLGLSGGIMSLLRHQETESPDDGSSDV